MRIAVLQPLRDLLDRHIRVYQPILGHLKAILTQVFPERKACLVLKHAAQITGIVMQDLRTIVQCQLLVHMLLDQVDHLLR